MEGEYVLRFRSYVRAGDPQEAYELLTQKKGSRIVGGGMWMRLSKRGFGCAIDLAGCGLDGVELVEDDPAFGRAVRIGSMCTLRTFECDPTIAQATDGLAAATVRDIVGVQFRNQATVGGSVCGRFGFSDVCCALVALGAELEFVGAGRVTLEEHLARKATNRDVLTAVVVPADGIRASYQAVRRQATDFPVVNACVARVRGAWRVAVGARPARARLVAGGATGLELASEPTPEDLEALSAAVGDLTYSDNMWASGAYRRTVAPELVRRAIEEACR